MSIQLSQDVSAIPLLIFVLNSESCLLTCLRRFVQTRVSFNLYIFVQNFNQGNIYIFIQITLYLKCSLQNNNIFTLHRYNTNDRKFLSTDVSDKNWKFLSTDVSDLLSGKGKQCIPDEVKKMITRQDHNIFTE